MPRGGARVGAGRKPQTRAVVPFVFGVVGGGEPAESLSAIAPADLPVDQRRFWQDHAAAACEAGTLTRRTEGCFRLLAETAARKDRTARLVARAEELVKEDAKYLEPLIRLTRTYVALVQRTEALMARFGVAPSGKPIEGARRKTAPNGWEQFGSQSAG